jgi:hypothetical protein
MPILAGCFTDRAYNAIANPAAAWVWIVFLVKAHIYLILGIEKAPCNYCMVLYNSIGTVSVIFKLHLLQLNMFVVLGFPTAENKPPEHLGQGNFSPFLIFSTRSSVLVFMPPHLKSG